MAIVEQSMNGIDVEQLNEAIEVMSANSEEAQFVYRAETEWMDAFKSITEITEFDQAGETVSTRELTIESADDQERPGDRTAPTPAELQLAALGACLSIGYAANAAAMGIELNDLRFELEADIDVRGYYGISKDVRPGFNSLTCTTYIDADASEEELAELRKQAESTSPLVDIITNAVPLETDIVVS